MLLVAEGSISRPPAEVFRFVATDHFHNHPKWDPSVREIVPTTPGPMRVGSTARLVREDRGKRVEGVMEVTEYEPDRSFTVVSRFGAFVLTARATLEPLDTGRTRLRLAIDTQASGLMRFLLPLFAGTFRKTMARSLQTIKEAVEAGSVTSQAGP